MHAVRPSESMQHHDLIPTSIMRHAYHSRGGGVAKTLRISLKDLLQRLLPYVRRPEDLVEFALAEAHGYNRGARVAGSCRRINIADGLRPASRHRDPACSPHRSAPRPATRAGTAISETSSHVCEVAVGIGDALTHCRRNLAAPPPQSPTRQSALPETVRSGTGS